MAADKNQLPGVNIMKLSEEKNMKILWNIFHREAGFVTQPLLFWLSASPNGSIYDKEYSDHPGLLKIKCPSDRRNSSAADLLNDQSF